MFEGDSGEEASADIYTMTVNVEGNMTLVRLNSNKFLFIQF
jgi:hypothetical protein